MIQCISHMWDTLLLSYFGPSSVFTWNREGKDNSKMDSLVIGDATSLKHSFKIWMIVLDISYRLKDSYRLLWREKVLKGLDHIFWKFMFQKCWWFGRTNFQQRAVLWIWKNTLIIKIKNKFYLIYWTTSKWLKFKQ